MKNYSVLLFAILLSIPLFAQQANKIYRSRNGKVGIGIYYTDTLLNIGSDKLIVVLDYETTEIFMRLSPSDLITGIDSLDEDLQTLALPDVIFKGKLNVPFINTEQHVEEKFDIEGTLTINGVERQVMMSGTLEHMEQGPNLQSMLYIHYDLSLEEFGLKEQLPGFGDNACIEITEAILSPEPNN